MHFSALHFEVRSFLSMTVVVVVNFYNTPINKILGAQKCQQQKKYYPFIQKTKL